MNNSTMNVTTHNGVVACFLWTDVEMLTSYAMNALLWHLLILI